MTDFATLGMDVDSSGLVKGRDELGRLTEAGGRAERGLAGSANKIGAAWKRLARVVGPAVAGLAAAFGARSIIRDAENYELRLRRIQAILKATGGVAGRSSAQLEAQAQSLARASLASVDGIMAAQQTLLTFRNIRGQVFDETIQAALDLSTAMGQDLNSSILQVAKALEDPVRGMTALSRSGTVFTDQQREMVKAMVEAGDTMGAQNFILSELNAQYGGAAQAVPRLSAAQDSLAQSGENARRALNDLLGITDRLAAIVESADTAVQFFTNNIESFAGVAIAASVAIGIKLVPAIWGAVTATYAWVAALVTLKGALIATGVGALIVSAGLLIGQFIKLVQATGSFADAFRLSRDVVVEVAERIKMRITALGQDILSFALGVESGFKDAMAATVEAVGDGVRAVAGGVEGVINIAIQGITNLVNIGIAGINKLIELANKVPGIDIGTVGEFSGGEFALGGGITAAIDGVAEGLRNSSNAARQAAIDTGAYADILNELAGQPLQSVNALKQVLSDANTALTGGEGEGMAPTNAGAAMGDMGASGGGGAGGGGGLLGGMERLNELLGQFQEQDPRAAIEAWHSEAMAALNDANLIERGMMEEHNAYKLAIEELYQQQLAQIRQAAASQQLRDAAGFFGAMASVAQTGGSRMIKIAQSFSAIQGLINSWTAYTEMLKDPSFIGRPWARFAAAASVLAAGLNAVKTIRSAASSSSRPGSRASISRPGSSGISSMARASSASATSAQAAESQAQRQTAPQALPTQTLRFDFGGQSSMGMEQLVDLLNDAHDRGYRIRAVMA